MAKRKTNAALANVSPALAGTSADAVERSAEQQEPDFPESLYAVAVCNGFVPLHKQRDSVRQTEPIGHPASMLADLRAILKREEARIKQHG